MADFVTARLEGGEALARKLESLGPRIARKHLRKAVRNGAKGIQKRAVANVPVQLPPYRGQAPDVRLVKKIKVRAGKAKRRGDVVILVQTAGREEFGISASDKFYYPAALEYGHDNVAPRPYMRQAFDQGRQEATTTITNDLRTAVAQEAMRQA